MRCWQCSVWLAHAAATRQRGWGKDLPHKSSSGSLQNIRPGDRVFRQTCCFSQKLFFSHFLQADSHLPFSRVSSLGRSKGPKEEAGISLLGLSEWSVTDWVACTIEIHFLFLKNNFISFFVFGCAGSLLPHRLSSSCGMWWWLSSCGA